MTENLFSMIPLQPNGKIPCKGFDWKQYQTKKPLQEDFYTWDSLFPGHNIGLVTGAISNRIIIDLDDKHSVEVFEYYFPGLDTMQYRTNRGKHIGFSYPDIGKVRTQTITFQGVRMEIKSDGAYVVCPTSTVDGLQRTWETNPEIVMPTPREFLELIIEKKPTQERAKRLIDWQYNGKVHCIHQIMERKLSDGEREVSLFTLRNLLLQNRNQNGYVDSIIMKKNQENPLPQREIDHILKGKEYTLNCNSIRSRLDFIDCSNCPYLHPEGRKQMDKKNLQKLNKNQQVILLQERVGYSIRETAKFLEINPTQVVREKKKIKEVLEIEDVTQETSHDEV